MFEVSTYLDRITSQHKTKPKFMALLKARLQPFIDLAELLNTFDAAFDLDTAVGVQLDTLGQYIGVGRLLKFQPEGGESPILDDETYRMLLRAKISMNMWDGTIPSAKILWNNLFPDFVILIRDNQDMTLNITIIGWTSVLERELVSRGYFSPKPMGVSICFDFIAEVDPKFFINTNAFLLDLLNFILPVQNITFPKVRRWNGEIKFDGKHPWNVKDAVFHGIETSLLEMDDLLVETVVSGQLPVVSFTSSIQNSAGNLSGTLAQLATWSGAVKWDGAVKRDGIVEQSDLL